MPARVLPLLTLFILAGRAHAVRAQAPATASPLMYASAFVDWRTGPDGIARMNLVGDSTSPTGLATFRLRYPAGAGDSTRTSVHFHLGTEHILVLKGTLVVGMGDSVNYGSVREYGPEGFVVIPSGRPHYHWTRGETEIHVEAIGPTTTIPWPRRTNQGLRVPPPAPPRDTTTVWPNGLPPWSLNQNGGGRMNLVGSTPPSPTELVASRSQFPARLSADTTRITYHYHFGTEHITILKGTLYFAIGDHVDRSRVKAYGPGSFIENPAGAKHFEWFGGEVVAHIESVGSLGAIPLDPSTGQPR